MRRASRSRTPWRRILRGKGLTANRRSLVTPDSTLVTASRREAPRGRAVYLSELYEVMERVPGVDHVESIAAPPAAIPLERDQLPVSGIHVVTVI